MAAQVNNGGRRGNVWITTAWVTVTALLLLTPLVAMQFTDEVNWTVSDFAFAGAMLVGCGIIYELAARAGNRAYQAAVVVALAASVLIMWTTGAVGIIGSEANPGNLLYVGVVALVIVGALIAGGRAKPMTWVMGAAAFATGSVPIIAYGGVADPAIDVLAPEVMIATCVFIAMWLLSARLFWSARPKS
jgi:hypothetical protein